MRLLSTMALSNFMESHVLTHFGTKADSLVVAQQKPQKFLVQSLVLAELLPIPCSPNCLLHQLLRDSIVLDLLQS